MERGRDGTGGGGVGIIVSGSWSLVPSDIRGNEPDLKDRLSGRSLLVDLDRVRADTGEAFCGP